MFGYFRAFWPPAPRGGGGGGAPAAAAPTKAKFKKDTF
jgi:hypothetical protein